MVVDLLVIAVILGAAGAALAAPRERTAVRAFLVLAVGVAAGTAALGAWGVAGVELLLGALATWWVLRLALPTARPTTASDDAALTAERPPGRPGA